MQSPKNYSIVDIHTEETSKLTASDDLSESTSSRSPSIHSDRLKKPKVNEFNPDLTNMTRREKSKYVFMAFLPLIVTLVINVGLPLALYYILKNYTSQLVALIVSGVPPLLLVLYTFIRKRKLDIIGCIAVVSFIVSAVVSIVSGDVRLTLLRDSVTTATISLMFFITLIPIRTKWFYNRPLVFLISQQTTVGSPPVEWTDAQGEKHSMPKADWSWEFSHEYRKFCYILTAAWSFVLMGEFVARVIMIEATSLDVDHIILYGNIIVAVVTVTMTLSTIYFSIRLGKHIMEKATTWKEENDFTDRLP